MSFSFEMSHKLSKNPVHLGLGATALSESEFTGIEWYSDYGERPLEIERRVVLSRCIPLTNLGIAGKRTHKVAR